MNDDITKVKETKKAKVLNGLLALADQLVVPPLELKIHALETTVKTLLDIVKRQQKQKYELLLEWQANSLQQILSYIDEYKEGEALKVSDIKMELQKILDWTLQLQAKKAKLAA